MRIVIEDNRRPVTFAEMAILTEEHLTALRAFEKQTYKRLKKYRQKAVKEEWMRVKAEQLKLK